MDLLRKMVLGLVAGLLLGASLGGPARAAGSTAITAEEAHAIGIEAYLYFYPLITMDLTRRQLTNVEPGSGYGGPPK